MRSALFGDVTQRSVVNSAPTFRNKLSVPSSKVKNSPWPFFLIKSSACSIAVSNTTCYCNLTFLLLVFIYIWTFEWFIFSRSIQFMYLMNCFRYVLVSSLLLTGHLPTLSTLFFRAVYLVTLKMGLIACTETSVWNNHSTLRNTRTPEEGISQIFVY